MAIKSQEFFLESFDLTENILENPWISLFITWSVAMVIFEQFICKLLLDINVDVNV